MGPPPKSFSQTTITTPMNQSQKPPNSTPLTTQIPAGVSLGMSPASRYNHNIKVLRRRDPSILSIFDQFSHVCLYHHDGTKWVKNGFEGTMFLFERNTYPPYGFYILNRVGSEDFIHRIYPEDEFYASGEFLIIKNFPEFLKARLQTIEPSSTGEPHDKFSDVYLIPNIDSITKEQKGRPEVISLWMMAVSSRDTMTETLKRLHSFIKQNKPYPEEFRYGPGKPPPPHRLKATPRSKMGSNSESESFSESQQTPQSDSENDAGNQSDAPSTSGRMSEIDMLFQNIQIPSVPPTPSHQHAQPTKVTLDTLFASASSHSNSSPGGSSSGPISPSTTSNGPSLLTTIFASAASSQSKIYSPQPSTTGPQVLTQDVLSNLLGLPPSRTASAASTFSTSASAISHPSSREGDNEDDSESESPGGFLDPEEGGAYSHPQQGPNLARQAGSDLLSTLGFGPARHQARINGDVTPRGTIDGLPHRPQIPSAIETVSSISTVRGVEVSSNRRAPTVQDAVGAAKPRANRNLVPFEPDSELWPYSRGPVDESSPTEGNDEGDIVELNFEDTSVLSDPAAFDTVLRNRRSAISLKGTANSHTASGLNGSPAKNGMDEGKKSKKGKKARKEAKTREEIEKSWDYPTPPAVINNVVSHQDFLYGPPASPSPCASPELGGASLPPAPEMKTPTMNANAVLGHINGNGYYTSSQQKGNGKTVGAANGRPKLNGHIGRVDPDVVSETLVAAVGAQPHPIGKLERNEFVKEVLTLIHTDKAFVDSLWQQYMARFA